MAKMPEHPPWRVDWDESLARSKAQIEAGERVALLPVLDRLRRSAEQLEAEHGIAEDGAKLSTKR